MNQVIAAADAAWKVLLAGLILGSGLPALFSFGVRQLAAAHVPDSAGAGWHSGVHKSLAYAAFALALAAVGLGLAYIIAHGFGVRIVFEGLIPVIVEK